MSREWLTDEEYEYCYERVPRACVDLLIETDDGVLLTKRTIPPYEGQWHMPGGRIRHGERLEGAIRRISQQEIGVEAISREVIGMMEFFEEKGFIHTISTVYGCTIEGQITDGEFFKSVPDNTVEQHAEVICQRLA